MELEQIKTIVELRSRNLTPKEIARKLGLKPAAVKAALRQQAIQSSRDRQAAGLLPPVKECLVNAAVLSLLEPSTEQSDTREVADVLDPEKFTGMAVVIVMREAGFNRCSVCTYLVDIWCLGIKDASGPRQMNWSDYQEFVDYAYQGFGDDPPAKISLEQAQAIVFSALEYADALGFKPHKDFAAARPYLGEWNGETKIECGRDGIPCYFEGPYDRPEKIVAQLEKAVGKGNFEYVLPSGDVFTG